MSSYSEGFTRAQRGWARFALVVSFLLVGGVAATMSYTHIKDVSLIAHQGSLISHLMPLAVDGMMLIATVAIFEDKASGRYPRGWARFGFWVGAIGSTAANIASVVVVWGWDWLSVAFAGAPPLLLMLSVEIVSKPGRLRAIADAIRHVTHAIHTPAGPVVEVPVSDVDFAEPVMPAAPVMVPAATGSAWVRRGRPEDDELLSPELVALALQAGAVYREQNGREITRDALRADLRASGWPRGISNVTAGRLLEVIRNDGGQPDRDVQVAGNGAGRN